MMLDGGRCDRFTGRISGLSGRWGVGLKLGVASAFAGRKEIFGFKFFFALSFVSGPETRKNRSGSSRAVSMLAGLKDFLRPFSSFRC